MPEGLRPSRMMTLTARRADPRVRGHVLARGLLFLPALGLLGFTLWRRAGTPAAPLSHGEPTEPMRTGEVGSIDGWEARVMRDGSAPLRLRLESLHPEAGRQAFDAAALARALRPDSEGRAEGAAPEPWRLTISVAARPGADSGASTVVIDDVSGIQLVGLEPLVPANPTRRDMTPQPGSIARSVAHDPLVSLLAFPKAPIQEGESCDLIFWGMAPEGSVRAIVPGFGDVELMAKTRAADRSSGSIARLDGRPLVGQPKASPGRGDGTPLAPLRQEDER